jgi:hypothetical protein
MLGLEVPSTNHDETEEQNEHDDGDSNLHAQLEHSSDDQEYADTEPMNTDHD